MKAFFALFCLLSVAASLTYTAHARGLVEELGNRHLGRRLSAFGSTDPDIWDLLNAVEDSDVARVEEILACECVDLDLPIFETGRSVLYLAARLGNLDIVRRLIQAGADPSFQGKAGFAPLHSALLHGHVSVAKELVAAGADVNAKTVEFQEVPLHYAPAAGDDPEVVEILVAAGAEVDVVDVRGETPLHEAVAYGAEKVARALLERGADVHAQTGGGTKPIDFVCSCLREESPDILGCLPGECTNEDMEAVREVLEEFIETQGPESTTGEFSSAPSAEEDDFEIKEIDPSLQEEQFLPEAEQPLLLEGLPSDKDK